MIEADSLLALIGQSGSKESANIGFDVLMNNGHRLGPI
jgi:hypothetical protein